MGMKFKKDDLIGIVQKNRDAHRGIFEEAIEGYRKKVIEELEAHLDRVKAGEVRQIYVSYPKPDDHTRDYDRLLKMLDMTSENEVQLSEQQFGQYVLDDWDWKRQFIATNSAYSVTAARLQNGEEE
jgi:hypothetical protein